ncbi:MAG: DNA repair protein RecO [Proteobacteria bacterium]|nr:DNA repair protein RecO [Burkholderiales bacterium]
MTGVQCFVLHTYPFRETSLIVEAFTSQYGRVAWVARGARRARSATRGLMLPFQPMAAGWGGKNELRTLHKVEWIGGLPPLRATALLCGLYLNELLLRLLKREDPHERLFERYRQALIDLAGESGMSATLRRFERELLREIGYALVLDRDAESGEPIDPAARYIYRVGVGAVRADGEADGIELRGQTLLDLAQDRFSDPLSLHESKTLTRRVLAHYLGEQPLRTRDLLRSFHNI